MYVGSETIFENTLCLEKLNFCSFSVVVSLPVALVDVSIELVVSPQLLAVAQLVLATSVVELLVVAAAVMSCNQSRVHFHIQPKRLLFLLDSTLLIQCDQVANRAKQYFSLTMFQPRAL